MIASESVRLQDNFISRKMNRELYTELRYSIFDYFYNVRGPYFMGLCKKHRKHVLSDQQQHVPFSWSKINVASCINVVAVPERTNSDKHKNY